MIFGYFAFILSTACFERPLNLTAIALAVLVAFFYGGLIFGLLPLFTDANVSWEYHFGGCVAGIVFAAGAGVWNQRQAKRNVTPV